MKKIALLFSAIALTLMVSCGPGKNEAIAYNDHIMDIVNNLTVAHNGFLNQIDGHNIDSLKMAQKVFSEKSKASLDEANKVGPFAEKTDYLNAAVEYFKTINAIADNEGMQMVEIMSKDSSQVTMEDIDKVDELAAKFDASYEKSFNMIQEAQTKFASEWKFEIDKSGTHH